MKDVQALYSDEYKRLLRKIHEELHKIHSVPKEMQIVKIVVLPTLTYRFSTIP